MEQSPTSDRTDNISAKLPLVKRAITCSKLGIRVLPHEFLAGRNGMQYRLKTKAAVHTSTSVEGKRGSIVSTKWHFNVVTRAFLRAREFRGGAVD